MPLEHVQEHIDLIAKHEQEFLDRRSTSERVGDAIAAGIGSLRFVMLHVFLWTVWILLNSLHGTAPLHFDPYPFAMLDTIVALEAILLASFILMRQSRIGRRADEREHLILQILLLTERETTALIQLNREMAARLGMREVARDQNLAALGEDTPIDTVAENIKDSLPTEG